jgi:hypothetical protein
MTHIAEQVATQHNKQVEPAGSQHFYVWNASFSKVIWFFFTPNFVVQPYWQSSTRGDS